MSSPNHRQAEVNSERLNELAVEIYTFFTYRQPPLPTDGQIAQEMFEEAVSLASDPASDKNTIATSGRLATMLHPWVVKEGHKSELRPLQEIGSEVYNK